MLQRGSENQDLKLEQAIREILTVRHITSKSGGLKNAFSNEEKDKYKKQIKEMMPEIKQFSIRYKLIHLFFKLALIEKNNSNIFSEEVRTETIKLLTRWRAHKNVVNSRFDFNTKDLLSEVLLHIGCSVNTTIRYVSDHLEYPRDTLPPHFTLLREWVIEIIAGVNSAGEKLPPFKAGVCLPVESSMTMLAMLRECSLYYRRQTRLNDNGRVVPLQLLPGIPRKRKLQDFLSEDTELPQATTLPPLGADLLQWHMTSCVESGNQTSPLTEENVKLKNELAFLKAQLRHSQSEISELSTACEEQRASLDQLLTPISTSRESEVEVLQTGTGFNLFQERMPSIVGQAQYNGVVPRKTK